jgi:hypothetical protein
MTRVIHVPTQHQPEPISPEAQKFFGFWVEAHGMHQLVGTTLPAALTVPRRPGSPGWSPCVNGAPLVWDGQPAPAGHPAPIGKPIDFLPVPAAMELIEAHRIEVLAVQLAGLAPELIASAATTHARSELSGLDFVLHQTSGVVARFGEVLSTMYAAVLAHDGDDAPQLARERLIASCTRTLASPEAGDCFAELVMFQLSELDRYERKIAVEKARRGEALGRPAAEALRGLFSDPAFDGLRASLEALTYAWRREAGQRGGPDTQAAMRAVETAGSAALAAGCDAERLRTEVAQWSVFVGLPNITVQITDAPRLAA